nr:sensor histidine kinase [Hymenobacter sp. 15J16-1T3B]
MLGKSYFDAQHRLLRVQKAQAESELKTLRAQIDPHFLFNNLNILYALIQQDREEASHFLSCFSSLYRYLIRHRDVDLVPLEEELRFADEYIYLLRHRFGQAYDFQTTLHAPQAELHTRLVVPGTLQVLIENVIKHNRGGDDVPLLVTLDVHPAALTVRNRVAPKRTAVDSTGTGLRNLRERYRLLADEELQVQRDEFFTVTAPLLPAQPAALIAS